MSEEKETKDDLGNKLNLIKKKKLGSTSVSSSVKWVQQHLLHKIADYHISSPMIISQDWKVNTCKRNIQHHWVVNSL